MPPLPILHADVDAFFAAVEQRDDPALRGRPVVVGGGVVMAASYEARAFGIRGGMGGGEARRRCPGLLVARPRFTAYVEASRAVFEVFRSVAPVVEGLGMEEAFMDVGPAGADGPDVARQVRREVRDRTGLAITVGVARSKILAKMASRAAKPDGLLVVPAEEEAAFLHPMRVEELWGVGAATARRLQARGMTTIGDVAAQPVAVVVAALGDAAGRRLHEIATNRDRRPVVADRPRRSFGAQRAGRRSSSADELDEVLRGLVDRLCRRMHRAGRAGRTVVLRLRFGDFTRATRAHTLPALTAEPEELLGAARLLMDGALPMAARRGLTLVGLTITNLDGDDGPAEQLELELALGGRAPPGGAQRTPTRSTTKTSVSSGPITPPAPRLP